MAINPLLSQIQVLHLFDNKLLSVVAGTEEVDATIEVADIEGVGTEVAFHAHHSLTHDVVDRHLGVLAQRDDELTNGGVGIQSNVGVVFYLWHSDPWEDVIQVEGKALIEVVARFVVASHDESAGVAVSLAGHHKSLADYSGLRIYKLRV